MRHNAVVAVLVLVALAGCSRLTFIKSNPDKRSYESTSNPVEIRESPEARQRLAANNRLILAQRALGNGDLATAETEARKALEASPESADAHTLLAFIAERRGQRTEAGALYQRAAELTPRDGGALNNYGTWLCRNGRAAESVGWFDRALASPGYSTPAAALANAGSCAEQAGQYPRAERDLRAAIELDPVNGVALGALARLAFRNGQYMDARAFSQRRLATGQVDAPALLLASQIEQKLGDATASARYVRRLREEFPGAVSGNPGDATQR